VAVAKSSAERILGVERGPELSLTRRAQHVGRDGVEIVEGHFFRLLVERIYREARGEEAAGTGA
jgi:hypothetical protein